LGGNNLGPEGGVAIAEALKINKTITNIKCGFPCLLLPPFSCLSSRLLFVTATVTTFRSFRAYLYSLGWNGIGPEGGVAIAEALKINKTITNIKYGFPCLLLPPFSCLSSRLLFVTATW